MKLIVLKIPVVVAKGRLCSFLSKNLLRNKEIVYLLESTKNVVVSGSKTNIEKEILEKRKRGSRRWGPFYPQGKDDQIRRCLRGMVDWTTKKGKEAYKRFFTTGDVEKIKRVLLKQKLEVKEVIIEELVLRKISKYSPSTYFEK